MSDDVPLQARVRLIHGVLQVIADEADVDVLHIKGPTVSAELLASRVQVDPESGESIRIPIPRVSGDADVLVRSSRVEAFLRAAEARGWQRKSSFRSGSAFGHALNIYHPRLGSADVHRRFPGIGIEPERAFDELWARRQMITLGHRECAVPATSAQRLILLLHAARSGGIRHIDTRLCWVDADATQRDEVRALAQTFEAELGLAAAIGELDQFKDHREYHLWRHFAVTDEASRLDEWRGRMRAAATLREKATVAVDFVTVNRDYLEERLGHRPSRREVVGAYLDRWRKLLAELTKRLTVRRHR